MMNWCWRMISSNLRWWRNIARLSSNVWSRSTNMRLDTRNLRNTSKLNHLSLRIGNRRYSR